MANALVRSCLALFLLCLLVSLATAEYTLVERWGRNGGDGTSGTGPGEFYEPFGLTLNATGYVYVADTYNHRIQVFTPDGLFVRQWGSQGSLPGQFTEPYDVSTDPDTGDVYVVDRDGDRIQVFSPGGQYLDSFGSEGRRAGEFRGPTGVALSANGTVYVADRNNERVQYFDRSGTYLGQWGTEGTGSGQFDGLRGLVVNRSGYVYTTDREANAVQVFSARGDFVARWGEQWLDSPIGIAVDGANRVYVADYGDNQVHVFDPSGTPITAWGYASTVPYAFLRPTGIDIASDGRVYVSEDEGDRVAVFKDLVPPPVPAFAAYPNSGTVPLTVRFLDYSFRGPVSWVWEFGDGTTSFEREPIHVYEREGRYTVSLTVTNEGGASETLTRPECVVATRPFTPTPTAVAEFSANATAGPAPVTVAFTDASSPAPYHRWWTFGDGSSSTDANPVHTYTKAGTYTVNLTAWTGIGSATVSKAAFVAVGADPRAPTANFTLSRTSGTAPLYVRFTDTSTGAPTSWRWSFGGLAWTTATSPNVVFRQPGIYPVTLTATNAFGSSTMMRNLSVTGTTPRSAKGSPVSVVG